MAVQKVSNFVSKNLNSLTLNTRVRYLFDVYEEYIGVKEVKKIQQTVLKCEAEFVESSRERRLAQNNLTTIQEQLKQIRQKLDTIKRSDEAYLELVTNEHKLLRNESALVMDLKTIEETERENFSKFSQKLREAHEVERLRQEKSKFISLIGSIVGAILGIIATSINHAMKMKDFKQLVKAIETKSSVGGVAVLAEPKFIDKETQVLALDATGAKMLLQENLEVSNKKIEEMMSNAKSNLEYKMKINAIVTVVTTYALLAITIPFIMKIFE